MAPREHEHEKPHERNRPEAEAAREPVPHAARTRGPEERTPGEDLLGEDLRARDELAGEPPPSPDELLERAELAAEEEASERLADLEPRRAASRKFGDEDLGPTPPPDADALERRAAWEHEPDLERAANLLEGGEGEVSSLEVTRAVERASFDEEANAAYDEEVAPSRPPRGREEVAISPEPVPVTGGGRELEPPPQSVLDVERGRAAPEAEEPAPARKRARRAKKAEGEAGAKPRRTSRRAGETAKKTRKEKATEEPRESDASP